MGGNILHYKYGHTHAPQLVKYKSTLGLPAASLSPDPLSCLINGLQKLLPLPHQLLAHCLLGSQLLTKLALCTPGTHLALHILTSPLFHISAEGSGLMCL